MIESCFLSPGRVFRTFSSVYIEYTIAFISNRPFSAYSFVDSNLIDSHLAAVVSSTFEWELGERCLDLVTQDLVNLHVVLLQQDIHKDFLGMGMVRKKGENLWSRLLLL